MLILEKYLLFRLSKENLPYKLAWSTSSSLWRSEGNNQNLTPDPRKFDIKFWPLERGQNLIPLQKAFYKGQTEIEILHPHQKGEIGPPGS